LSSQILDRKIAAMVGDSFSERPHLAFYAAFRRTLIAGVLLAITAERSGFAQTSSQQKDIHKNTPSSQETKRNVELNSIVDLAAGIPSEFGADSLLRLVESAKITDRLLKAKLLEKAFYLAESAQQPIKLVGIPGSLVDTRSGYLAMAFRLNLDKLSLQSRAVIDLLQLDRIKGEKLFEQIRFPTLKPLGCEESLTYDPSSYYQALDSILNDGSIAKEESERRVIVFLQPAVTEISSHTQVSPVAKALTSLNLPSGELEDMTSLFIGSMEKLQRDERSFAVMATQYNALGAMARLVSRLDHEGLPTANALQVLRQYVIRNLQDCRCPDNEKREKTSLPRAAQDFNELFGAALVSAKLNPIRSNELQSYKLGPAPSFHPYWQSPTSKELLAGIKRLRFGTGGTPVSVAERKTAGWNSQLSDFLAELELWKSTDEEGAGDFFHEKCVLYTGLIDLIPPGPEQSNVIRSYGTFLELNSVQGTNGIEWFWHVKDLLERLSATKEDKGRTHVLDVFRDSRDPTLNLYARVEAWLSQTSVLPAL
jgi:hypothetical protein